MFNPGFYFWNPMSGSGSWKGGGPLSGSQKGSRKHDFVEGWVPTRFPRIFREGNGFYGTQEPFGCTNYCLNPPGAGFTWIFHKAESSWGPLSLLVGCLLPIGGLPSGPWGFGLLSLLRWGLRLLPGLAPDSVRLKLVPHGSLCRSLANHEIMLAAFGPPRGFSGFCERD